MEEKNTNRFPLIITIILAVLVIGSLKSISNLNKGIERLTNAEDRLEALKLENEKLQADIEYAMSDEYLEKAAVEKLNMTKPGYKILVVESVNETRDNSEPIVLSESIILKQPNWELWIEEFNFQKLLK